MPGTPFERRAVVLLLACAASLTTVPPAFAGVQSLHWGAEASAGPDDGAVQRETALPSDVWQRIRDGLRIDDAAEQNPLVGIHAAWYAARPDYVQRMIERSRRYLYHIVEEVDRRAMPMEIALLPMIESAFNPTALSPSDASGIWQFIPSTGRHYGLKQDAWYDGRRDFPVATGAALDYLGKLYLDFGDWQLALAAYNCGEGCVARAIQKNLAQGLPTDYASLPLPTETRHYVPKLLAVRQLVRTPEAFGVAFAPLPNEPYFEQVLVHASLDVSSAARLAGVSRDEFLALNAAFPRQIIRSDTPVSLLVPAGRADAFQRNLESGDWDSWQPYAAQRGERPETIARILGVPPERLAAHNQFQLRRGKFVRPQTILVPVKGRAATAPAAPPGGATEYVTQAGDTLFGIARRHGLDLARLREANPGLDPSRLHPGVRLTLPVTATPSGTARVTPVAYPDRAEGTARTYTVERGDTLHAIARRFDIALSELRAWNPALDKTSDLRPGQRLTILSP